MQLNEREMLIPRTENHSGLLNRVSNEVLGTIGTDEMPVRFAITKTDNDGYHCELGILSGTSRLSVPPKNGIFDFRRRNHENIEHFNAVLLIPTGIGAEIGGHSGDAGPVARLLATACDNLVIHPNVVNAADINEYPENALYVEGSVLSRLLMGTVGLQKVRSNRVLLIIYEHPDSFFQDATINTVSAARATWGLDCPLVVKMNNNLIMRSLYSSSGRAVGRIEYFEQLCAIIEKYRSEYDAVALSSIIEVPHHFHEDYFRPDMTDMVNPWGGVEAMLTHAISLLYDVPSAHSPMTESKEILNLDVGVVDPRKAAEAISTTYLHCILKGLHKSPRIINNPPAENYSKLFTAADISCLVIPYGCVGLPTLAALEQGIPVIAVRENTNRMRNILEELPFLAGKLFVVNNYLEAVGVMHAIKAGVNPESVRRPLGHTNVCEYNEPRNHTPLEEISQNEFPVQ